MKISKEVKVGFITLLAIAILVWGYNFLKGTNLFVNNKIVYTVYPRVPGLSVSAPVIINGVQSGIVDGIYFHPDKSSKVVVKLSISESELIIPKNSVAELISVDFLGSKAIGLNLGNSLEELEPGDTLRSEFELSMLEDFSEQMLPIKEKAENMMDSLKLATASFKELADNMNDIFDEKRKRDLKIAMSGLKGTLDKFDVLANDMSTFMKVDMRKTLKDYREVADSLKTWEVNETLAKANAALDSMTLIMAKVNSGEGTMGQLLKNDSLYRNLEAVSRDMDKLMIDFKEHPKRYVHFSIFGRRDKPEKNK